MDQELLLFRRFLVSPQWINPIRLFIGKAYCAQLYDHSFNHVETNRRFYQEYCKLIEDLLISFSCNYNVDATRVSEFVDISIEQAQSTARHLIATRSSTLFVQFMKGCDVHLKWQSTEAIQLKLDRKMSSDIQPKEEVNEQMHTDMKKMVVFKKEKQDRQYFAIQKLKPPVKINMRSCDQLRQALEASPGITMAMAYGFVPSYHTTEHIMNKWYKEQRLAQYSTQLAISTASVTPENTQGDCSNPENHNQSQDEDNACIN